MSTNEISFYNIVQGLFKSVEFTVSQWKKLLASDNLK